MFRQLTSRDTHTYARDTLVVAIGNARIAERGGKEAGKSGERRDRRIIIVPGISGLMGKMAGRKFAASVNRFALASTDWLDAR